MSMPMMISNAIYAKKRKLRAKYVMIEMKDIYDRLMWRTALTDAGIFIIE